MKTISRWASRPILPAAFLIIGCEITNAFAGLLPGLNGRWLSWLVLIGAVFLLFLVAESTN